MRFRLGFYGLIVTMVSLGMMGLGALASGSGKGLSQLAGTTVASAQFHDNNDNNDNSFDNNDNGGDNGGDNNNNDNNNNDNNDNSNNDNNDNNDNGGKDNNDNGGKKNKGNNGGGNAAPVDPNFVSACATAGVNTIVTSSDGRVRLQLFPTLAQNTNISIRTNVARTSLPVAPGPLVDALVFEIAAAPCGGGSGIGTLPVEVNLGVHYSDLEASGLTEARFALARLEPTTNTWVPATKQAADPTANFVSATITQLGTYAVFQQPT